MISQFKDKNPLTSVQNEIRHLIGELKKCEKSELRVECIRSAKEMKKKVDKEVKLAWKKFVGKDQVLVDCSACMGSGYQSKYVGKCCGDSESDSAYTSVRCDRCNGDGKILMKKVNI